MRMFKPGAILQGGARPRLQHRYRVNARQPRPWWPLVSIVILLFGAVILVPILITMMNIVLVMYAFFVAVLTRFMFDHRVAEISVAFVLILLLGLATGLEWRRFDYLKDAWYIVNPLLVLLVGYILFLAHPRIEDGLKAFILGGVIVAFWQLRGYVILPDLITLPAIRIREIIGTGFYAPVVGLVILLNYWGRWQSHLKLGPLLGWTALLLCAAAVLGVFSRTSLMVTAIGAVAALGIFAKREWLRVGIPVLILACAAWMVEGLADLQSDQVARSFGGKVLRSFEELTLSDNPDDREINLNFRAYETRRALDQFERAPPMEKLFGQGFGAMVDLGVTLPLQRTETGAFTRHIGIFHNGYVYLLTKTGLIGLGLFVCVLARLYWWGRKIADRDANGSNWPHGRLLQGCAVTLAFTTYIVGGVFNKFALFSFVLLVGYLLGYLRSLDAGVAKASVGVPGVPSRHSVGLRPSA